MHTTAVGRLVTGQGHIQHLPPVPNMHKIQSYIYKTKDCYVPQTLLPMLLPLGGQGQLANTQGSDAHHTVGPLADGMN